jgi:hypothetical protein
MVYWVQFFVTKAISFSKPIPVAAIEKFLVLQVQVVGLP